MCFQLRFAALWTSTIVLKIKFEKRYANIDYSKYGKNNYTISNRNTGKCIRLSIAAVYMAATRLSFQINLSGEIIRHSISMSHFL